MRARWLCVFVPAAAVASVALAQATIYESKDKAGPVYSDKPSPGAQVVDLPPPNVVSGPPPALATPQPPAAAPAPAYRTLAIASPVAQGTVHSNSGAFDLTAQLSPALRPGDRILVSLDGRVLPTRYRSLRIHVTTADWQAVAGGDRAEHTLQLAVADAQGRVLIDSAPVNFYVHRAAVGGKGR